MKFVCKIFISCILCAGVLSISACGKISDPKPIEGSGYPHTYPKY